MNSGPIALTAFLDILGYSNKVKDITTKQDADELIALFDPSKEFADFFSSTILKYELIETYNIKDIYNFEYLFISDSIIISFHPKEDSIFQTFGNDDIENINAEIFLFFLNFISILQVQVLEEFKLPIRGGISAEPCFIDKNHAVGKGLSEAHDLESKNAIYPRVIFDKKILDQYKVTTYTQPINAVFFQPIKPYLIDSDGYAYVDYLSAFNLIDVKNTVSRDGLEHFKNFIILHDDIIKNEISKANNTQLLQKYEWLASYQQQKLKDIYNVFSLERFRNETSEMRDFLSGYMPESVGLGKLYYSNINNKKK